MMTRMVWRVDVGDFRGAFEIRAYALRHRLALPDQYKRSTPCLLVEEFAEAALRQIPLRHSTTRAARCSSSRMSA
ncbi:phage terminase small subunit [Burkholderia ubonensis]|uniref:phage terminase small subunit n=1 Tax=Burkholderia ubonensis TaxID=101571 RepID=UPI000756E73F|nr:phage terminase small subunit [Burkholderia ubonensis]KVP44083.1 hypothetical protein WJ88_29180 [Burkholderia ubonensis]